MIETKLCNSYTNPLPDLYPQGNDTSHGWGLTFMITMKEGQTGRGRNTGWWLDSLICSDGLIEGRGRNCCKLNCSLRW